MAVPINKQELITEISINYNKLKSDLTTIPQGLTAMKELEGHSKGSLMSIHDLVAYLVGWAELVLKWHQKKENREPVDIPETGFKWTELGKLAEKFYDDYKDEEYFSLLRKLDKTINDILSLIDSKTNEQLYKVTWYDKWPLGRMIQLNTSSPFKNARARVRKWKKHKGLL